MDEPPRIAPGERPPPKVMPPPDHAPPSVPARGCARFLAVGCGGFLALALAGLLVLYLNAGWLVTLLERKYIQDALDQPGVDPRVKVEVDRVLADYDGARKKVSLSFSQWKEAAASFSRSASGTVLRILQYRGSLDRIAGLTDEERRRAQDVLDRLGQGAAEAKVSAEEVAALADRARQAATGADEKPRPDQPVSLGTDELRAIIPEAERLATERGLAPGPYIERLPDLLRRDLWTSLKN